MAAFTRMGVIFLTIMAASSGVLPNDAHALGRKPPSHLVVALGDSITVGTLANTTSSPFLLRSRKPLERALSSSAPTEQILERPTGERSGWQDTWRRLQAEGLRALLSPLIYNQSTHSWVTGHLLESHEVRIRRSWKSRGQDWSRLKGLNLAVPGAETSGLIEQASRLVDLLAAAKRENGGEAPRVEYIAMTIGANDSCNATGSPVVPDEVFEAHMREALALLASGARAAGQGPADPVKVLISAIPPVPTAGAPEFRNHEILPGITCEKVRQKLFRFCPNLLDWSDEVGFQERMEIVRRKNAVLDALVRETRQAHPELAAAFGASVADVRFEPEDLAIDCFHPDMSGQKMLSETLWRDQPWY